MKLMSVIVLLMLCFFTIAQDVHPYRHRDFKSLVLGKYNYIYSDTNSESFYQTLMPLTDCNDPDSSYKASKIMWGLFLFSDCKYPLQLFEPLLQKISVSNKKYFEQSLIGRWRFSHDWWSGMVSQLTTTTAVDTLNSIHFDGHHANFYFNGTLVRRTKYILQPRETNFELTRFNKFDIYFFDSKQIWSFTVSRVAGESPSLSIETDPTCVCGCRHDVYKKID